MIGKRAGTEGEGLQLLERKTERRLMVVATWEGAGGKRRGENERAAASLHTATPLNDMVTTGLVGVAENGTLLVTLLYHRRHLRESPLPVRIRPLKASFPLLARRYSGAAYWNVAISDIHCSVPEDHEVGL